MELKCDQCGKSIFRDKANFYAKGSKRNFCNFKCVSFFRKTQIGKNASRYKHGGKGTRLYRVWKNIKTRCFNKKSPNFKWYGSRGISMCKSWKNDFSIFKKWSESNGYDDLLQLDRINNNGSYEPDNCRFVTRSENRKNSPTFKRTPEMNREIISLVSLRFSYPKVALKLKIGKATVYRCIRDLKSPLECILGSNSN